MKKKIDSAEMSAISSKPGVFVFLLPPSVLPDE